MPERQAGLMIQLQPNLPPELFARIDPMNDDAVYSVSIFVTHIDQSTVQYLVPPNELFINFTRVRPYIDRPVLLIP